MRDVLIPLGLLLFIGLLAYAIVHTARKQRIAKAAVFREFATKNGLRYRKEDDGKAQSFARDFDGIGQFSSPSLGKVLPTDVVEGMINGSNAILFRHSIRFSAGWTREWFVAGVTCGESKAERCTIQFCRQGEDKSTVYLEDPVVREQKIGSFNVIVRALSPSYTGKWIDDAVLKELVDLAEQLPFRPEIQIRGNRVAAYLADRNATVDSVEVLGDLLAFAKRVAAI